MNTMAKVTAIESGKGQQWDTASFKFEKATELQQAIHNTGDWNL